MFDHLDFCLPGYCFRIVPDCPPHVRLLLHGYTMITFPGETLMENPSIAIWNRNTVVVSISLIVWGTNVAFLIQGKYFLSLR